MPGQVVAIRRLPSGDALLTMDEEKSREAWLKDTKWLEVYGQGARVKRRAFIILAHGITVNQVQVQDQEAVRREIYKQNPKWQDQVEILRVAWAKKLVRSGRTSRPLQVSVAEPEQANLIIESGLIWNHQIHECEPYNGNCIVTQCFKCYSYGHVAKMCRNTARCGFCAAPGHATRDCIASEDKEKHRCVPCTGNHPSWARECTVRQRQIEAANLAYRFRPARFQVRQTQPTAQPVTGEQLVTNRPIAQPTHRVLVEADEDSPMTSLEEESTALVLSQEWNVVQKRTATHRTASEPPAKRPRGRPVGSTKAAKNNRDIRSYPSTQ